MVRRDLRTRRASVLIPRSPKVVGLGTAPPKQPARPDPEGRLFNLPERSSPQTVRSTFNALSLQDFFDATGGTIRPPDSMGAIGPDQYLEVVNSGVGVFNRAGQRLSYVQLSAFFTFQAGGQTFPDGGTGDPRVLFDRRLNRWIVLAFDVPNDSVDNHVLIAISRTPDALGVWDKYAIDAAGANEFADYPTLGLDSNGLYIGLNMFQFNGSFFNFLECRVLATPLPRLVGANPSMGPVTAFDVPEMFTPQPPHVLDAVAANAPAHIVATDLDIVEDVNVRKITWANSVPQMGTPIRLETAPYVFFTNAPAKGSTSNVDCAGDRLMMAMQRGGRLWTSRTVGVGQTGTSAGANRLAAEWFEIDVSGSNPAVRQTGRVFDPAAASMRHFYFPSIAVNGQGHAVMSFSGSGVNDFVGAFSCGRLPTDALGTMGAVEQFQPGLAAYTRVSNSDTRNRWGDYSYTSVDPTDDQTFWTVQEFAAAEGAPLFGSASRWGTVVGQLASPAPSAPAQRISVFTKTTNAVVELTGAGLWDPGDGFPKRFTAAITGGAAKDITNLRVAVLSATRVRLTFNVASNAGVGPRSVVLTNPDGQQVTIANALNIVKRAKKSKGKLTITPSPVAFPTTAVGATSGVDVTLTNTGSQALSVKPGTLAAPFSAAGLAGEIVLEPGAGAARVFRIEFKPTQAGEAKAKLKFKTNAKKKTTTLKLSGVGQ